MRDNMDVTNRGGGEAALEEVGVELAKWLPVTRCRGSEPSDELGFDVESVYRSGGWPGTYRSKASLQRATKGKASNAENEEAQIDTRKKTSPNHETIRVSDLWRRSFSSRSRMARRTANRIPAQLATTSTAERLGAAALPVGDQRIDQATERNEMEKKLNRDLEQTSASTSAGSEGATPAAPRLRGPHLHAGTAAIRRFSCPER